MLSLREYIYRTGTVLNRPLRLEIEQGRSRGFRYDKFRKVACGVELGFKVPSGYSYKHVMELGDTISASIGRPVEIRSYLGAIGVLVIEKDFPLAMPFDLKHYAPDKLMIGYNRMFQPMYHKLNTHILSGGASGGGKTDLLRFLGYQLYRQGYEIKICDFKGFSFFPFESLPNVEIVDTLQTASKLLERLMNELIWRKKQVKLARSRKIIETFQPIVCIIDEGAALAPSQNSNIMKVQAEYVDNLISLFAQQGREPRMFLIYATQRPDANIINRQLKANVEAAVAFRTKHDYESRIIIGSDGAEKISPATPGRCIYSGVGDHLLQVPYIGDDDAWDEFLMPLRTEVIHGGNSKRTEAQRAHLEGSFTSAHSDNGAASHTEPSKSSRETGKRRADSDGGRKTGQGNTHGQHAKALAAYNERTQRSREYSDDVDE